MANASARVLIVDDERFFREEIRDNLSARGFRCTTCEDGEAALKLAAAQSFAVAVVDIQLPGIDGVELLQQLRVAQPDIRVIMLASLSDQELVLEALRQGACEYLAKPLHEEELILSVGRAVEAHRVAIDYRGLRSRLDELVDRMEVYSRDVDRAEAAERPQVVRDAAVHAAAHVLDAEKTSLLLLNEDRTNLDVVAALGRDLDPEQMDSVRVGQGIAGRALEDSAPLAVADIRAESHFAADLAPDRYETNSFVVAPVEVPSRQFGVLCATDRRGGLEFGHDDLSLLRAIAVQLAEFLAEEIPAANATAIPAMNAAKPEIENQPTIVNDRAAAASDSSTDTSLSDLMPLDLASDAGEGSGLYADARDGDSEMARAICDVVSNEMDPDALLREALRPIEASLAADPVSLYLIEAESGELVKQGAGGRSLRLDHDRLPVGPGLTGSVLGRGQMIAASDPEQDPRYDIEVDAPVDGKPGPLLAVPVKLRGKTVGLCRIHLAAGAIVSARTGELLVAVLSAAVRNLLLYRSLLESIEEVAEARREARG